MDNKEKLNLDDITFDDFIDGGLATTSEDEVASELAVDEVKPEVEDLDKDIEEVETKEEEKKEVEEEVVETTSAADDEVEVESSTEEAEVAVVSEVLTNLGYELEGDYDDTVEGLTSLTKDVASTMAEEQLDSLFEQYPEIQQHLEFVLNGGNSNDFYTQSNRLNTVSNVNVTEEDINTQRAVLVEYFRVKGHDDNFIRELLQDYSTTDKLYDKAVMAKEALVKYEQQNREQSLAQQKENLKLQQEEANKFWENVSTTIQDSREFSGIVVQERDKKKFFDYISKPVDSQGNTKRDLDHNGAEMDVRLAIDYLMFKGFKLDEIIKAKAKTETAKTLRKQIKRGSKSVKGAKSVSKNKSTDLDNLDLSLTSL